MTISSFLLLRFLQLETLSQAPILLDCVQGVASRNVALFIGCHGGALPAESGERAIAGGGGGSGDGEEVMAEVEVGDVGWLGVKVLGLL